MFGYSAESLQKAEIDNFEKELESKTKLINIKPFDICDRLENINNLQIVQGVQFKDVETQILVNAKLFLNINRNIDIKEILKNI